MSQRYVPRVDARPPECRGPRRRRGDGLSTVNFRGRMAGVGFVKFITFRAVVNFRERARSTPGPGHGGRLGAGVDSRSPLCFSPAP